MDVRVINEIAACKRASLPALSRLSIVELLAMPPLFDWVECRTDDVAFRMFLGGNDDGVALRFYWNGEYEAMTLRAWAHLARHSALAVDVGAHTGAYTLAAYAANPGIAIFAFEPHFMNYARLNLNLRANGHKTNNSYQLAVGPKDQIAPFTVLTNVDYLTTGGSIGTRPNGNTRQVEMIALDHHLSADLKSKIGLLKIDVEGYEAECLAGMRGILKSSRPVIFFECLNATAGSAVETFLAPFGYRYFAVDDAAGTISPVNSVVPYLGAKGQPDMHKLNRIAVPDGEGSLRFVEQFLE